MVTRWGAFMWRVSLFGMMGGPVTFQRQMDVTLRDFFDFAAPYMDDIIVFSKSSAEHLKHLELVFSCLHAAKFYCNASKCLLGKQSLVFCGFRVDGSGVSPVASRVEAILAWPRPPNFRALRMFLGLCVFFKRFLRGFSKVAAPLHALLKRGVEWRWEEAEEQALQEVLAAFRAAETLHYPDPDLPFVVYVDASSAASGFMLCQERGRWRGGCWSVVGRSFQKRSSVIRCMSKRPWR